MPRFRSPSPSPVRRGRSLAPHELSWQDFDQASMEEDEYIRSRDESRERENDRRRMQTVCIKKSGGYKPKTHLDEGPEGPKLFWDGFQWVAKNTSEGVADPAQMNSTRKLRRLYFGNLPLNLGLTETAFQELLWQEMLKREYSRDRENCPIICVWFAKDKGTYGFVEFATVEDTDRALGLDGLDVLGVSIKVSRPNDYATTAVSNIKNGVINPLPVASSEPTYTSSPFVILKSIVLPGDLDDETWADALEDVEEGCSPFGLIRASIIVSDTLIDKAKEQGIQVNVRLGDVIVEFETAAVADRCIAGMTGRKYNDRNVQVQKLSTEMFSTITSLVALCKGMNEGLFRENQNKDV